MVSAQIAITVLTVAAFVLSAVGLMGARRHAQGGVLRMEQERSLRQAFREELKVRHAETQKKMPDVESFNAASRAASVAWLDAHSEAGIEPWTNRSVSEGREFLAERIIRELDTSTRGDVILVGLGLLCGLTAGIWDIWLR